MFGTTSRLPCGLFAFFLAFFGSSLSALAEGTVVAARSSNLTLYDQAATGFRDCAKGVTIHDTVMPSSPGEIDAWVASISKLKPAVILSLGTGSTKAVREKLKGIPSIFCIVLDPASNGLSAPGVRLDPKASVQVEFIKKSFPQLKRIGVIVNPVRNKELTAEFRQLNSSGKAEIVILEVSSADEMPAAISKLAGLADCLLMVSDPSLYSPQLASQFILQTIQEKLPLIGVSAAFVKAGAFAGVYSSPEENGCIAAGMAQRIMGGEKIDETFAPAKVKSSINLLVAKRLNITVAPAVIDEADLVIK